MKERILRANAKYQIKVEALLRELSTLPEETLNKIPSDGGWTAIQTAWHLLLVEENSMLYVQKKLGFGASFEKVGFKVRWRTFLLLAALYLPIKFKAPKTSSGENLPTHSTYAEIGERWNKSRAVWTEFLSQMPAKMANEAVFKHPRAGKIGWLQMLVFFEAHFDRHLRQIRRALA